MSTTGQQMFQEGRRIVNQVADTAEKNLDEFVKKASSGKKSKAAAKDSSGSSE